MKGLLNVLYKRILYKIPLKFLLILLAVFGLFIAQANAESLLGYSKSVLPVNNDVCVNDGYYCNISSSPLYEIGCDGNGNMNITYNVIGHNGLSANFDCPVYLDSSYGSGFKITAYGVRSGNPTIYTLSENTADTVFSPIITGLTNSINEFIPYVVYIGIGVLGILISFVAIRWLINFIRNKILTPFK